MSKESKLIKNTLIIAIGNIGTKFISFFMLPLYTSILSTSQYGTIDLIGTYTSLITIVLTLQFEQGLFRYLIEVRNNPEKQKKYIYVSIKCIAIFLCAFIIIGTSVLCLLDYQYTFYLVTTVVVASLNAIVLQIARGLGYNSVYAFGSFLCGSLNVGLNVVLVAIFRKGVEGMLFSTIISLFISAFYIIIKLRLWNFLFISKFENRKRYLTELLKYSLPLVPYTLCWWVISASDRMLIELFIGISANGIYAAAYKIPSLFSMITNIFQLSWSESASENINDSNRNKYYNNIMNKSIRFYSSCNMGIIAFVPIIFDILFGKNFSDAYQYIPILVSAALFHSIAALYGSIYFAFKKTKEVSTTTFIAAIINFIVNLLLIKFIGLYAAALSSLIAYIVITIIRHLDVQKLVEIKISGFYIMRESIVYVGLIAVYFSKCMILQLLMLIVIVLYCFYQNRDMINNLIDLCLKTFKRLKK